MTITKHKWLYVDTILTLHTHTHTHIYTLSVGHHGMLVRILSSYLMIGQNIGRRRFRPFLKRHSSFGWNIELYSQFYFLYFYHYIIPNPSMNLFDIEYLIDSSSWQELQTWNIIIIWYIISLPKGCLTLNQHSSI